MRIRSHLRRRFRPFDCYLGEDPLGEDVWLLDIYEDWDEWRDKEELPWHTSE